MSGLLARDIDQRVLCNWSHVLLTDSVGMRYFKECNANVIIVVFWDGSRWVKFGYGTSETRATLSRSVQFHVTKQWTLFSLCALLSKLNDLELEAVSATLSVYSVKSLRCLHVSRRKPFVGRSPRLILLTIFSFSVLSRVAFCLASPWTFGFSNQDMSEEEKSPIANINQVGGELLFASACCYINSQRILGFTIQRKVKNFRVSGNRFLPCF